MTFYSESGVYRETQRGEGKTEEVANIEENTIFCEFLSKISQKGGGEGPLPPLLCISM